MTQNDRFGPPIVTKHARDQFLKRIDGGEIYPTERIRREFEEARPLDEAAHPFEDQVREHPESGAWYVHTGESVVVTVVDPTEEQLGLSDREGPGVAP